MSEFEEYKQKVNLVLKKLSDKVNDHDERLDKYDRILLQIGKMLPRFSEILQGICDLLEPKEEEGVVNDE